MGSGHVLFCHHIHYVMPILPPLPVAATAAADAQLMRCPQRHTELTAGCDEFVSHTMQQR